MTPPIVILGAGPAGLAAAEAASADGQPVLLIDENGAPGGQIWRGGPAQWRDARATRLWRQLEARPHVRLLCGTRVVAQGAPGTLLLDTPDGPLSLPWQRAIVCSGARELLLPFPGWTLPGVTGAGGLQAMLKGGMPIAGKRVVVAGSGPLLLAVAETVLRHGGRVAAIVEHRGAAETMRFGAQLALHHRGKLWQAMGLLARLRGIAYLRGATLVQARGEGALASVLIERAGVQTELACDIAACGYGLLPTLDGAALFGCAVDAGAVVVDEDQLSSTPLVWAAGESTGIGGVDKALAEGRIAGLAAVGKQASRAERRASGAARAFARLLARSFGPTAALRALCTPATIVCRCEDVRARELAPHASWRAAKLQTRVGMGSCQGRVCGAACAFMYEWDCGQARPPVFPVSALTLASVE
jgi:NADPH-dependent 2,4-dienoyl-CoA reductase/sulfur reductase-like enzyme